MPTINRYPQEFAPYCEDIYDINVIADEIVTYTGASAECVWRRLAQELHQNGTNVMAETVRYGVTPHVFDERMLRFYKESDGFIYETCVESRNPHRMSKWFKIAAFLMTSMKPGERRDVLVYGDSVGSDSIFLRRMGLNVYYHEYDGYCSRFAEERFKRRNLNIHSFVPGASRVFDFVVCFEVAEHVSDPLALIKELSIVTAADGYCIFSESFGLLEPQYPTHLKSNLKYVGMADELFLRQGLHVSWRDQDDKPIVYTRLQVPQQRLGLRAVKSVKRVARSVGRRLLNCFPG